MAKPELRFPEFTDEWEEHRFGNEIIEHVDRTSDKVKYPLYSLTIEDGVVPKSERYEREFLINKEGDVYKIVPPNAFVYNPMNLRFGALKVNHQKFSVSVSGYYNIFSLRNVDTLKFWENYLTTNKMLNYYYSIATGTLIEKLRVHFSQFVNIEKPFPNVKEQKRIADFFSSIDDMIQVQKEEISALEEQKKAILQKIFNRKLRFKADDGSEYPEWEEKKLEEVVVFLDGQRRPLEKGERLSGIYPYYGASGIIDYVDGYLFEGEHILLSEDGANIIDRNYRVCFLANGKFWVNNHAHVLKARNGNDNNFICEQLERLNYIKYNTGTAQPKLNQDVCKKIKLKIPCFQEQQKIAVCLLAFAEIIQIKRDKLAIWKNIKKGLLQKMFV